MTVTQALARRLPIVLSILALAIGFGIGQAVAPEASKAAAPPKALVTPEEINKALLAHAGHLTGNDRGYSKLENGVQHSHGFEKYVDANTRKLLAHQMEVARETALMYPTLADAERAGLRRNGPFSPGLGTHMISQSNFAYSAGSTVMTDEQIRHPLAWIYDGTKPNSPVAGLFYSASTENPVGFAGPNDIWHKHHNICITSRPDGGTDAPLGADKAVTKAMCDAVGGVLISATPPLLHVWPVPGYEDNQGIYAHLSPAISCNDGTYREIADLTKIGKRATTCLDGTE